MNHLQEPSSWSCNVSVRGKDSTPIERKKHCQQQADIAFDVQG